MKNKENARASIIKMLIICIAIIFGLGLAVKAGNIQVNSVKIELSDHTELNVMTSKTKVSEILNENHIIILEGEKVIPDLEEEIGEDKTIRIVKESEEITISQTSNEEVKQEMNDILNSYAPIVEKIVVEQVEIPYETITKDNSGGNSNTRNRVIQQGQNGLKEVTYNVKYKNDVEIERTELSSVVIKEPINKIVQVNVQTSRSGARIATTNPAVESASSIAARVKDITPYVVTMNTSAYCSCAICCGKTNGITSSGAPASSWYTVAAGSSYPIGTVIYIPYFSDKPNGGWFVVQDRGGAISNSKLDIYMGSHGQALQFGRRSLECYIYEF